MELGCHRELDYFLLQVPTVAFEAAISEVHKLLCKLCDVSGTCFRHAPETSEDTKYARSCEFNRTTKSKAAKPRVA